MREFLPKEYTKTKGVEKRIFQVSDDDERARPRLIAVVQEHKKLHDLSELDAKLKYTQLCRSLRTYGVTFFLVKVGDMHCTSVRPYSFFPLSKGEIVGKEQACSTSAGRHQGIDRAR